MQLLIKRMSQDAPKDVKECHVLSMFLLLPLLSEFIAVVSNGGGSIYTIILNIIVFVLSLLLEIRKNNFREIGILFGVYIIFLINYAITPNCSKYYFETPTILVLFIYMPIAIFCIRRITSWNSVFAVLKPYCLVAAAISVFIVFFNDVYQLREFFSYMEYSYNVIPFVACSWVLFREDNSYSQLIVFLITLVCVVLFGSRAALFCLLLFVLFFEIYVNKGFKRKMLIVFSLLSAIMIANIAEILAYVIDVNNELYSNSYIISRLTNGSIFTSDGRDEIYSRSLNYLSTIGLEVSGFFSDRIVNNGIWPHNIFLELVMQFGWLIGPVLCLAFVYILLKSLFTKGHFVISLFIILTFIGRYWFSGSYLIEGKFWISLFSLITIIKIGTRKDRVMQYK